MSTNTTFTVRLPADLVAQVDHEARTSFRSRNGAIAFLLAQALGAQPATPRPGEPDYYPSRSW
jgi:hypothetical protein